LVCELSHGHPPPAALRGLSLPGQRRCVRDPTMPQGP
jgi:hypothetical protein